jgi:hypothetical protein
MLGLCSTIRAKLVSFSFCRNGLHRCRCLCWPDVITPTHALGIAGWKAESECGLSAPLSASRCCPKLAGALARLVSAATLTELTVREISWVDGPFV